MADAASRDWSRRWRPRRRGRGGAGGGADRCGCGQGPQPPKRQRTAAGRRRRRRGRGCDTRLSAGRSSAPWTSEARLTVEHVAVQGSPTGPGPLVGPGRLGADRTPDRRERSSAGCRTAERQERAVPVEQQADDARASSVRPRGVARTRRGTSRSQRGTPRQSRPRRRCASRASRRKSRGRVPASDRAGSAGAMATRSRWSAAQSSQLASHASATTRSAGQGVRRGRGDEHRDRGRHAPMAGTASRGRDGLEPSRFLRRDLGTDAGGVGRVSRKSRGRPDERRRPRLARASDRRSATSRAHSWQSSTWRSAALGPAAASSPSM